MTKGTDMQDQQSNLFLRNDTILGVCEGIGQDFGFNANWLRVALCAALFFSPVATIAAYLGLGVLVLASRLIAPPARVATDEQQTVEAAANDSVNADLPIAA